MNSAPYEVIAGPFTAWLAQVGVAFPTLNQNPASVVGWNLIGKSGAINYDRGEGVMVRHPKNINTYRGAADPRPLKNFVVESDLIIEFSLADMTLRTYRLAVANNAIQQFMINGSVPAHQLLDLTVGNNIPTFALLLRSDESPYQQDGVSQYEIAKVQEIGSSEVQRGSAGNPAKIRLQFSALVGDAFLRSQDDTILADATET